MRGSIRTVAVVGGGTAGWLAACVLSARHPHLSITLVEAPNIPTIGVGEGTWPTMRETLASIGIAEAEFLRECDASFKQGSRFDGWVTGSPQDSYLHPFTLPPTGEMRDLLAAWQQLSPDRPFAEVMTAQAAVCAANLAPRQRAMPDYGGAMNYAYHLDAGKFAALLSRHATERLGVQHLRAEVANVLSLPNGDLSTLQMRDGSELSADLFLDCTGQAALLIGQHMKVEWIDRSHNFFNDRALAVQVPVAPGSPVASQTIGTAHAAGWLWDIGLPSRRGIGCVYSSRFMADDVAVSILRDYVSKHVPDADPAALQPRLLDFRTGHRQRFWQGNCIAIGMSAGFIEPLEASAIVMIELSLRALADAFPADRAVMDIHADRFNRLFLYRWDRIVEFLKLHYALSQREEPYWQAQRDPTFFPARLTENLTLWRDHPPALRDFPEAEEIFPSASQQFVLYGMGFAPPVAELGPSSTALTRLSEVRERVRALCSVLPSNRDYLDLVAAAPGTPQRQTA